MHSKSSTNPVLCLFALVLLSCGAENSGGATNEQVGETQEATKSKPAFAYSGDAGPAYWGDLSDSWRDCSSGNRQSPIDIADVTSDPSLAPLRLQLRANPVSLVNNGHTIEQQFDDAGSLTLAGRTYELLQLHFHTLSEHTLQGHHSPMEMHAVFRAEDDSLAVIGLLYGIGAENAFLANFDRNLPARSGDSFQSPTEIDLSQGLSDTTSYYTYEGSLTTPPCSPTVTWIVLQESAELSRRQLQAFRDVMGNNFRPVQDLGGRSVRSTR